MPKANVFNMAGEMIGDILSSRHAKELAERYGTVRVTTRQSTQRLSKNAPSIRLALETIRLRAAEGITAADILPVIGGSRRSAERKFKAAVGHSLLDEILRVRFERVKELLATRIPLKAVSYRTGFSSENNLQRLFKRRFGMTLSEYRERHTR